MRTLAELLERLHNLPPMGDLAPLRVENEFGDPLVIDEVYAHHGRVIIVVRPAHTPKRPLGPFRQPKES